MTDTLAPEVRPPNTAYDEINRAHSNPSYSGARFNEGPRN